MQTAENYANFEEVSISNLRIPLVLSFPGSHYSGDEFSKEKKINSSIGEDFTDDENGFDIRCEVCDNVYTDLER